MIFLSVLSWNSSNLKRNLLRGNIWSISLQISCTKCKGVINEANMACVGCQKNVHMQCGVIYNNNLYCSRECARLLLIFLLFKSFNWNIYCRDSPWSESRFDFVIFMFDQYIISFLEEILPSSTNSLKEDKVKSFFNSCEQLSSLLQKIPEIKDQRKHMVCRRIRYAISTCYQK